MNKHVIHQIPDYVLNLLPRPERQAVEQHTAVCPHCQKALQAEREMGQMVRLTLHTATQPANGRLSHLMPPLPTRQKRPSPTMIRGWQRQLALVGVLVMILFGSMGLWHGRSQQIWGGVTTVTEAATATSTLNATATIAQRQTIQAQETMAAEITETAVAATAIQTTSQAALNATPAPPPTPIAALPTHHHPVN